MGRWPLSLSKSSEVLHYVSLAASPPSALHQNATNPPLCYAIAPSPPKVKSHCSIGYASSSTRRSSSRRNTPHQNHRPTQRGLKDGGRSSDVRCCAVLLA